MNSLITKLTEEYSNDSGVLTIDADTLMKELSLAMPKAKAAKRAKVARDPNKPKQPKSAFFIWCNEYRASVREELQAKSGDQKVSIGEVSKELSRRWKELSADDKAPYDEKSVSEREEYKVLKEAYQAEHGIEPKRRTTTKFDSEQCPDAPNGWNGPHDGYLEMSPKDPETGKNYTKSFHSFVEAVSVAESMSGVGGITRTPNGYKLRAANTVSINQQSRTRNEISWIFEASQSIPKATNPVVKAPKKITPKVSKVQPKAVEPKKESKAQPKAHESKKTSSKKITKVDEPEPKIQPKPVVVNTQSDDEEEFAEVEEFEYEGVTYLKDSDGIIYNDEENDEGEPIGRVREDGSVEFY